MAQEEALVVTVVKSFSDSELATSSHQHSDNLSGNTLKRCTSEGGGRLFGKIAQVAKAKRVNFIPEVRVRLIPTAKEMQYNEIWYSRHDLQSFQFEFHVAAASLRMGKGRSLASIWEAIEKSEENKEVEKAEDIVEKGLPVGTQPRPIPSHSVPWC